MKRIIIWWKIKKLDKQIKRYYENQWNDFINYGKALAKF